MNRAGNQYASDPYPRMNKVKRLAWNICWTLLIRPFPKSAAKGWKKFLLRLWGAKIGRSAVYSSVRIYSGSWPLAT